MDKNKDMKQITPEEIRKAGKEAASAVAEFAKALDDLDPKIKQDIRRKWHK